MEPVRYQQGRSMNMGRNPNINGNMPPNMNKNPNMNYGNSNRPASCIDSGEYPIGMGYVPMQTWCKLYPLEQGFCEGTIFMELNQIFCGKRGNRA